MSYPLNLRRMERAAIFLRRKIADAEGGEKAAPSDARPPGSERDALPPHTVSVAFSGGGIRCATFALGILQALAKQKRVVQIDILSTVSGGGYTGAFLGRLFTRYGGKKHTKHPAQRVQEILSDDRSSPLQWLRDNANYIVSQGSSDVREHLAVFWRNLMTIYFVLGLLGSAVFGLLRWAGERLTQVIPRPELFDSLPAGLSAAVSAWWWLPITVFALTFLPAGLAYWLAPKPYSRAYFSFFPLLAFIVLNLWLVWTLECWCVVGFIGIVILLLALLCLEVVRWKLPPKLDRSSGETSVDHGTVIRNRLVRAMGELLVILFVCLLWVVIDTLARGFAQGTIWKIIAAWGALIAPVAPFFRGWASSIGGGGKKGDDGGGGGGLFTSRDFKAGMIVFPVVAFLLVVLDGGIHWLFINYPCWGLRLTWGGFALSVVFGWAYDFLNYSSLQQTYGSRLGRTFLGASNPARTGGSCSESSPDVQVAHPDDDLPFDRYRPEEYGGPLHLIGLCVNETVDAASQRDVRDRKGLSMCVSSCGVTVGRRFHALWSLPPEDWPWRTRIRHLLDGRSLRKRDQHTALRAIPDGANNFHVLKGKTEDAVVVEPLRLGTWIAVSGAAFGTGTGRNTSLPLALLCGLVNLRLGYWWDSGLQRTERPGVYPGNLWRRLKSWPGKLIKMQSLLLADFTGRFGGPSRRFWNISDGGHFDVTGIYELIRRRVPFILAVDGGEDPQVTFEDNSDLVRQVRIDFGAMITFETQPVETLWGEDFPKWIAEWLDPAAFGQLSDISDDEKKARKHAALGKITYRDDPAATTWLVVLKASMTGDEPLDVTGYKRTHPAFPDESTVDQFFNESQYESYRMLGEHIGMTTIKPAPATSRNEAADPFENIP